MPFSIQDLEPLAVRPSVAWRLLDCGNTHGYQLLAAGELESYRDGRSRRITMRSIKAYIARRLAAGRADNAQPAVGAGHAKTSAQQT
jgi:excisionase family DNA binding protein